MVIERPPYLGPDWIGHGLIQSFAAVPFSEVNEFLLWVVGEGMVQPGPDEPRLGSHFPRIVFPLTQKPLRLTWRYRKYVDKGDKIARRRVNPGDRLAHEGLL